VSAAAEPDRIEYCLNGKVLTDPSPLPYPLGHGMSYSDCLVTTQTLFRAYWHNIGGTLQPMHKGKPLPDLVRVVTKDGTIVCQWSKQDEAAHTP
jgi:hypothetical protein